MKKNLMMGVALCAALAFVSCKSSESSYKKAYEKAKAQELAQTTTDQVETAPVAVTPVISTTPAVQPNTANDRQERLTVMNGGTLKAFNVVCGSFSKVENANNLRNTLVSKGYSAQVAQNPETGMYRVIASSFDDRASAVSSRDQLRGTYPDAWLLYRTY
ncbi:MAG: SPOR domain-containing protein [Bacteroidaceae bacterium]|jgi:cell division protein FtsN|nr:SPOR domain-containing protein [Bacteroidaceae bacterium]